MDLLTTQAQELRLSATLEINELVQSRLVKGKDVVHLGFGEATFPIHKSVLEAHSRASKNTSYMPVAGLMKLREVCLNSYTLGQMRKALIVACRTSYVSYALTSLVDRQIPVTPLRLHNQSRSGRRRTRIEAVTFRILRHLGGRRTPATTLMG